MSQFFNFVDHSVSALSDRYEQPGLRKYMELEQILLTEKTKEEVDNCVEAYPELDAGRLIIQLAMMRQQKWETPSVDDIAVKLASLQPIVRDMFDQVEQLKLLLTIPASNAEAECSFSALRRLKTFLRNSMAQQRLNHSVILHVHQEKLDDLDVNEIAREFTEKSDARRTIFGRFQ